MRPGFRPTAPPLTRDRGSQDQETPIQLLLDHEFPLQLFPDQLLPDHEFPLQELPDQELPDHEFPDQELPLQLLPDHEFPLKLLPFQMPPLQLVPAASRIAMGADSKAWPKMSWFPLRTMPSRVR